jgi:transposase
MNGSILDDEVWAAVSEFMLVPERGTASEPGRKQLDNRATLSGILFILTTELPWNSLPGNLGFGSGATCYRRLRAWQKAGAWPAIKNVLIRMLSDGERIEWWRAEASAGVVRSVMKKRAQARKKRERANRLVLVER